MKSVRNIIILTAVIVMLFSAGALAGGIYNDYKEEKESEIAMYFGQLESRAIAYVITLIEEFREEDRKRVDREISEYLDEIGTKLAPKLHEQLMATEYKHQTEMIKEEHDKLIKELKRYIEEQSGIYYGVNK